ncbi:MAG: hypothetical protein ACE5IO_06070 [Thermoplasmata archaeon]
MGLFEEEMAGAAKGIIALITKTLDDIPIKYSIHIWLDADRFKDIDGPILLDRIEGFVRSLDNAKEKDLPTAFDFLNAHVLIQRYTTDISRRILVVSAKWMEVT